MSKKKKQASDIFSLLRAEFKTPDYGQKQFKRDIAKLKKLGLVSKKVKPRSQQPTRYFRNIVRQFSDVLLGEAKPLPIPRAERAFYKESGHRVKNGRAVIPTKKGESVQRIKPVEGVPAYRTTQKSPTGGKGVSRTHVLFPAQELHSKLAAFVKRQPKLKKGEYYAFRYRGYQSLQYFGGENAKENLLQYMMRYIPDELDEDEAQDYYSSFEIVKIHDTRAWNSGVREQREKSHNQNRERNRMRHNAWRARRLAEMSEEEKQLSKIKSQSFKEKDAARQRAKRAALKQSDPATYAAQVKASAARVAKHRASKKK